MNILDKIFHPDARPSIIRSAYQDLENKFARMRVLKDEIKDRKAEYDMLEEQTVKEYLATHHVYKNAVGRELASYTEYERKQFNQSDFKTKHEDLYNQFVEIKISYKFTLK